jgi:hypothetical protein
MDMVKINSGSSGQSATMLAAGRSELRSEPEPAYVCYSSFNAVECHWLDRLRKMK